jgi:uncharacterized membrane protein
VRTVHPGISCNECATANFAGSRYKCMICNNYDLCATCFEAGAAHRHHPFVEKATIDAPWASAERPANAGAGGGGGRPRAPHLGGGGGGGGALRRVRGAAA